MAPVKFGLFKGRSRDQPEPPSTENLLQSSCTDLAVHPPSPIPSTSKGLHEDHSGFQEFALLHLDSDDEDESEKLPVARRSSVNKVEETQINYKPLISNNTTSTTTLHDATTATLHDLGDDEFQDQLDSNQKNEVISPDDATSVDAYSLQFDQTSILSEDVKYCGATRKHKRNKAQPAALTRGGCLISVPRASGRVAIPLNPALHKKNTTKEEQKIQKHQNDYVMWQASNYEVLQHLLSRSCTIDEQIKWEAIAMARGLCTLTATCTCGDCAGGKSPASMTDGDGGMGAPLIGAFSMGCELQ